MFRGSRSSSASGPDEPSSVGDDPRLRLLLEALADLSSTLDVEAVLDRILARSLEVAEADQALLLLGGEDGGGLQAVRARRADGRPRDPSRVGFSTTVVQRALREGRPVTEEVGSDSEALRASQSIFELRLRSVLCAPLRFGERTLGAIYVDSRVQRKVFTRTDRELFEALARQAAIAITNARALQAERERVRLQGEMDLAAEIQRELLPPEAPQLPGLRIAARSLPAAEVSGDFYDWLLLEDGKRLAFTVADVTGHGVGPALLAAEVRGEIRALLPLDPDPGRVLGRVHANLRETLDPGRFLTLFLGLLEPAHGRLAWASAGAPEALLWTPAGQEALGRTGPPLGVDVEAGHETQVREGLGPGTGLLLYTDGLAEARSAAGEVFGAERLAAEIRAWKGGAGGLLDRLLAEAEAFAGGRRQDDTTAMALLWR